MSNQIPEEVGTQPTVDEVIGSEIPDYDSVAVKVTTPVRTQSLPNDTGDMNSITFADTDIPDTPLFPPNPQRSVLTLIAKTQPMLVARNQATLRGGNGAEWPVGIPMVITHKDAVWVCAQTADCKVSWVEEVWTG
jgi:hypothetical protein